MNEIIKTLLVSLSFAATGAGIAWSVTSDARESFDTLVVTTSSPDALKTDRLDLRSPKADRLMTSPAVREGAVVIVYSKDEPAATIFRAPLVVASTR